ncbi:MAG: hypothetical protein OEL79_04120 [Chromatiales bacterium]|nr:hypothetical protein [Chromatiales bacterium]
MMSYKTTLLKYWQNYIVLLALFIVLNISGCSGNNGLVRHGFEFNSIADSPDILILKYRYGDSRYPGARSPGDLTDNDIALQRTGIFGRMRRGDDLYVKWQVKSTGEIYEDTVDLKRYLPGYISGYSIYFIVDGSQLHVYLTSPVFLKQNPCPSWDELVRLLKTKIPNNVMFSRNCSFRYFKIYPTKSKGVQGDKS